MTPQRIWDTKFNLWADHGCPKDSEEFPYPPENPNPDHPWNKDPVAYCKSKGKNYDPNNGGDEGGLEAY